MPDASGILYEETLLNTDEMEWISVKDRMPENGHWSLIFCWRGIIIASYFKDGFYTLEIDRPGLKMQISDVTHWMPLPEPPK